MIALAFALAVGLTLSFWLIVALLRRPTRILVLVVALLAWTLVGPGAFWAILGLTLFRALIRRCRGTRRPSPRRRVPAALASDDQEPPAIVQGAVAWA